MKYFVVSLVLFLFVGTLLYLRLRPYLRAARDIFSAFRTLRQGPAAPGHSDTLPQPKHNPAEMLVRCAACGTWTPVSRAVKLRTQSFCSHECLEKLGARRK